MFWFWVTFKSLAVKPWLPEVKLFGATGTAQGENILESEPQRGLRCLAVPVHPKSSKNSAPPTQCWVPSVTLDLKVACVRSLSLAFQAISMMAGVQDWLQGRYSQQIYARAPKPLSPGHRLHSRLCPSPDHGNHMLNYNHYAFNINSDGSMSYPQSAEGARSISLGRP